MYPLRSFVHTIDKTNDWIGRHLSYLMVPFILLTVFEVFMRYCLNTPTQWVEELVLIVFGPYSILGGAYTFVHKLHVKVDVLYRLWSPRKKAIADLITSLLFFFFFGLVLWKGGKMALESVRNLEHTQSVWSPAIYPTKLTVPVAASLVLLQGLAKFIRDAYIVVEGREME